MIRRIWSWIKWRVSKKMSNEMLHEVFLRKAAPLAGKGVAKVYIGNRQILNELLSDDTNEVFILSFMGTRIYRPKAIKDWFREYK